MEKSEKRREHLQFRGRGAGGLIVKPPRQIPTAEQRGPQNRGDIGGGLGGRWY